MTQTPNFNDGMLHAIRRKAGELMDAADPAKAAKAYFAEMKRDGSMKASPDAPFIKQAILDRMDEIRAERQSAQLAAAAAADGNTPASVALGDE